MCEPGEKGRVGLRAWRRGAWRRGASDHRPYPLTQFTRMGPDPPEQRGVRRSVAEGPPVHWGWCSWGWNSEGALLRLSRPISTVSRHLRAKGNICLIASSFIISDSRRGRVNRLSSGLRVRRRGGAAEAYRRQSRPPRKSVNQSGSPRVRRALPRAHIPVGETVRYLSIVCTLRRPHNLSAAAQQQQHTAELGNQYIHRLRGAHRVISQTRPQTTEFWVGAWCHVGGQAGVGGMETRDEVAV